MKGTTKSQLAGASWTNNNAESANHLKIVTQWKPRSLVELIEKFQGMVAALYKDVRRAIVSRGTYSLAKGFENCTVLPQAWAEMTQNQKDKAFKGLMTATEKPQTKYIKSTDGKLTVPTTPSSRKKPDQRKRKLAERTNIHCVCVCVCVCVYK